MHVCIYSQCINAFIFLMKCMNAFSARTAWGLRRFAGEKKPARWQVLSYRGRLASVHAPPEHMTEDADLLVLYVLEAIVLVRVLIAIEAAQANPGRQAIELFNP